MLQFILNYPDTLPGLLKRTSTQLNEIRFVIAGKLYDMGKLSSRKTCIHVIEIRRKNRYASARYLS